MGTTLHLIRAGLVSGLLTKKEVIDWADNIITLDEQPDIFFISAVAGVFRPQLISRHLNYPGS